WPGGMLAHADGSLYVTFGRYCHRLDPVTLQPIVTRALPRDRPYNSLLSLPGGQLVMKDIGGGEGANRLPDDVTGSELVVLAPGSLDEVGRLELPEGSIARLSAIGGDVYVIGESNVHRVRVDGASGTLARDPSWSPRYRTIAGQTFGWDVVLAAGSGWFLDNGEGSDDFGGSFRGKGRSTAPLHLVRVPLDGAGPVELVEVDGRPGGVIANPPAVDEERRVVVGYDSGHGTLAAWRFGAPGEPLAPLWRREQHHAGHMLRVPATGELLTYDFDHERGTDQAVVLDIETGDELGRVDTGSPVQCVLFPAPAPGGGAYVCTFAAVTRVYGE
ncbi:MAG TPA: hypothetical protein VMT43_03590, partial [Acidimicrobiales bacterium]|nr:hypothetical protein [Acidimicrobiales bacterium]